jgi:preprotein translocase subunit SecD
MTDTPKWKYILIGVVILAGLIYALPNVFPQDPAVQISANRGSTIDQALQERVQGVLEKNQLATKQFELTDGRLLVRMPDLDGQLKASTVLTEELGSDFVVALNLAETVPGWLSAIGARAMTLGLDLQGGVRFLMEVDYKASADKQVQRFVDDVKGALRDKKLRFRSVTRDGERVNIVLRSEEDRDKVFLELAQTVPQLDLLNGASAPESYQLIGTIKPAERRAATDGAIDQNLATLRKRAAELGVSEPVIQRQGESRIVAQLPGVQDTAQAKRILSATATLEYRAVDMRNSVAEAMAGRVPPESRLYQQRDGTPILLSKRIIVSGDQLQDASSTIDPQSGTPAVSVTLNNVGAARMQDFTNENVGNGMAVVFIESIPEITLVDGKEVIKPRVKEEVISVANVREPFGKRFQTTGLDSTKEASDLALLLRAGALAAPVTIVEQRVVGPSLGQDNIKKGVNAIIIGLLAVVVFVGLYYKVVGLIADFALILNLMLLVAVLSLFGATLTMPGMAGIVLTLGMAIDANVLICERIREELRLGSTPMASIRAGYEKAWATILDANVTHLLAAFGLMVFGSGPIQGFAITLAIGILTSMFTSVTVTHALVDLVYGRRRKLTSIAV